MVTILVLVAVLVVLALQNTAVVEVRLLLWTISMSRALLILFSAALGAVMGIAVMGWQVRRR